MARRIGVSALRRGVTPSTVPSPGGPSLLETVDVGEVVTQLERNGISGGLRLRQETLDELRSFADAAPCFGNGSRSLPFFISEKLSAEKECKTTFTTGRYFDCGRTSPTIRQLIKDSTLRSIASEYLGSEPVLIGARMWWSFAANTSQQEKVANGQAFHYDLDDYRAICFFFYLTDVDQDSGAHLCVTGSHRRKPLSFLLSPFKARSDESIHAVYGADSVTPIFGSAGDGFAEDIFCYHKGIQPRVKDRLILQIRYRLREYGQPGEDE